MSESALRNFLLQQDLCLHVHILVSAEVEKDLSRLQLDVTDGALVTLQTRSSPHATDISLPDRSDCHREKEHYYIN